MRTKSFKRRISNILLLGILIVIAVGIYYNIQNSRAENVIEIEAIAHDSYGYLECEEFTLEANLLENGIYEIELPESINGKKVLEILEITLEEKTEEEKAETEKVVLEIVDEENTVENEPTEEVTEQIQENEARENTEENNQVTNNETEKQEETEENVATESTEDEGTDTLEIKENKIQLTKEQIVNKKINIKATYDVAILEEDEKGELSKNLLSEKTEEERNEIEITEETEMLYNKILKYEDEENGKLVELRGFLPIEAEIKVNEVTQEYLTEIFGDGKIDVAYDIKILIPVEVEEEIEKEDGTVERKTIIKHQEINPEEFGETCEVIIRDANIENDSQVYHVKEDNTYELVRTKDKEEESISFETQTFSIYAVSADAGIMLAATATNLALSSVAVTGPTAGTYGRGQAVTIVATYTENVYGDASAAAVTSSTAPTLKIKFGTGTEKTATFSSTSGKTITYTCTIAAGNTGTLTATSYTGTVYDASGNSVAVDMSNTYCSGVTYTCTDGGESTCTTCSGSGSVTCTTCNGTGTYYYYCSSCTSHSGNCKTCGGDGSVSCSGSVSSTLHNRYL